MALMPFNPIFDGFEFQENSVSKNDQLYNLIVSSIQSGHLAQGSRLPPTRVAADILNVSRQTVVIVYERLQSVGLLESRSGAGYFVAENTRPTKKPVVAIELNMSRRNGISNRTNALFKTDSIKSGFGRPLLTPGGADLTAFPANVFKRIFNKYWSPCVTNELHFCQSEGLPRLRQVIAEFLRTYRGLHCSEDQILITNGTQSSLTTAAFVVADPGDSVIVENPSHTGLQNILRVAGLNLKFAPVDGEGMNLTDTKGTFENAKLAVCSPTTQYPLGITMSIKRRLEILAWADRNGGYIFEDDYDNEFCFSKTPMPPMFTMEENSDRIIYSGTFRNFLAPGFRVGYLVVPPPLVDGFRQVRQTLERYPNVPTQHACAEFISGGYLSSYLRKMKQIYRDRRKALSNSLTRNNRGEFRIIEGNFGLNLTLLVSDEYWENIAADAAASLSLGCKRLSDYSSVEEEVSYWGLVMGFADTPADRIERIIDQFFDHINLSESHLEQAQAING